MKRIFIYILIGLTYSCKSMAQNMRDLVSTMPDTILPLLTKNDRLDFIDYLDSNMKAEVSNKMGGKSEMTTISDDYTHIKMSPNSEVAFKLLPYGNAPIVCMIHTYSANASESLIKFYTTAWTELNTNDFIQIPSANKFLVLSDSLTLTDCENILNKMDVILTKIEFIKNTNNLTLTLTTPLYMSEENRKATAPHIRESITMKWNGRKFE